MQSPIADSSYRLPLILAIALHLLLFIFLFGHFVSPHVQNLELQPEVNIIKAVAVQPAEAIAEITHLKAAVTPPPQKEEVPVVPEQPQQPTQEALQAIQEAHQKKVEQAKQKEAAAAAAQKLLLQKQEQAQKIAIQEKAKKAVEAKKAADAKKAAEMQKEKEAKKEAEKTAQEETKRAELKKQAMKKEAEKKKQEKQEKAMQALKLAQQKELDSQMAAEKKQLEAARTNANQSEIEKYTALILHTMRQNWIMPEGISPELSCQLAIRLKSDGSVISVNIIRSSGNTALDNSARLAVFKSSPLPVPADKDLFNATFREINLTVSPKDAF
jgi:colicin import membrane protein